MDESSLNPPPKIYKVSAKIKNLFIFVFCLGLGFYFYLIIERRILQNRYMVQNQMAAIKLVPSTMPAIKLTDPLTRQITEPKWTNKNWTLLNLWATWCPPCKEEMPSLEFLQQKLGDRLNIIALSVDENVGVLDEFIKTNNPSFTVLFDHSHTTSALLAVDKYPETFLISPDGVLSIQFSGPRDWASEASLSYFDSLLK